MICHLFHYNNTQIQFKAISSIYNINDSKMHMWKWKKHMTQYPYKGCTLADFEREALEDIEIN